jgi:hypothetical protein
MRRSYARPTIVSEDAFEASALACGKTNPPPPGSYHFTFQGGVFTGHFGPGFGAQESMTGTVGPQTPASSSSYYYAGLCINWVSLAT